MRKRVFASVLIITSVLILVFAMLASLPKPNRVGTSEKTFDLGGCFVVHVYGNPHPSDKARELLEMLKGLGADVKSVEGIPEIASIKFGEQAIALFEGGWLEDKINDPELHTFLRDCTPKGVRITAIGGPTSKLFEALDKAGIEKLSVENGVVRNPAHWNPPFVGYRMTGQGKFAYPSILISNSDNVSDLVEALSNW